MQYTTSLSYLIFTNTIIMKSFASTSKTCLFRSTLRVLDQGLPPISTTCWANRLHVVLKMILRHSRQLLSFFKAPREFLKVRFNWFRLWVVHGKKYGALRFGKAHSSPSQLLNSVV